MLILNYMNIHSTSKLIKEDRSKLKKHKSFVIWFTGLSGAGKSTLAIELEYLLYSQNYHTYLLDGDDIRTGINNNLGFSESDRHENIRRIAEISKLFVDAGIITLVSAISPFKQDREFARSLFKTEEFIEVFVSCPINECAKRDTKGLYKKAQAGLIKEFTGISSPYEAPEYPEIKIETDKQDIEESLSNILVYLKQNNLVIVNNKK